MKEGGAASPGWLSRMWLALVSLTVEEGLTVSPA